MEWTLAVAALACSATRASLRHELSLPTRLLGIGLPLTIALGPLLAALVFGSFTAAEAVVLAVLLAPTDAALGQV
jgi:NhaP-type Na+/H+ or K+/H+ antiporter